MRVIRQLGTEEKDVYTINVKERDSGQDIGCIQISTRTRVTEKEALSSPYIPRKGAVTDQPPGEGYLWCSHCGWRKQNRFYKNPQRKSGFDNYCIECRKRLRHESKQSRSVVIS